MTSKRRIIGIGVVVVAIGALAGGVAYSASRSDDDNASEERAERAFLEANLDRAAVSQDEAEAAAVAAFPGSSVLESELEESGDGLIWEVEISDGSTVHEIVVDAATGEVLGDETEGAEEGESE